MYIAYGEVGAGALAGCSSVHVISSVHVVVGAQGPTAAASGCSRLLHLTHTPDSAWLPRGNTFLLSKIRNKSRKLKFQDGFFSKLVDFRGEWRVPPCSLELGGRSSVLKTQK